MKHFLWITFSLAFVALGFNNCSKAYFQQGALSSGVSKTSGTNNPDAVGSPSPMPSPSATPPVACTGSSCSTGDMCLGDNDHDDGGLADVGETDDDHDSTSTAHVSCMGHDENDDNEACETEDGHSGHKLGLCLFVGNGNALTLNGDPVVLQFMSTKSTQDVCISRTACDTLINDYLNKTGGVVGGPAHSSRQVARADVKYVNLSHEGVCRKSNPNVKTFTDAQIAAEISKLLAH